MKWFRFGLGAGLLAALVWVAAVDWSRQEERSAPAAVSKDAGASTPATEAAVADKPRTGGAAADESLALASQWVDQDRHEDAPLEKVREVKAAMRARHGASPAEEPLTPGRHWEVSQDGRPVVLELAFDELWTRGTGLVRIPEQPDVEALAAEAGRLAAEKDAPVRLVMYPRGTAAPERNGWNRRLLTDGMRLEWDGAEETRRRLEAAGLTGIVQPDYAPGQWTARVKGDAAAPLRVLEQARQVAGLRALEPLLAAQRQKKAAPNDPFFSQQWHLRNTGQKKGKKGVDANVVDIWDEAQGDGVSIAIIDDGVDLLHPDLAGNAAPSGHFDWVDNDSDPAPEIREPGRDEDSHGTPVAGVAAGRGGNGIGISGAAPRAQIVGLRLLSEDQTDLTESQAIAHLNDVIQVKNNSWGYPDIGFVLGEVGPLTHAAVQNAVETGRGGKGTILTWAAGNGRHSGDQSNKDGYANDRHVIAVGAVTNTGSQTYYSENGANVNVSAPSDGGSAGIVTTDLQGNGGYNRPGVPGELSNRDYTNDFGGTSSATPLIAGVAALMLEANPGLGWRDVKEIFLRSSVKLTPASTDWAARTGGRPDLAQVQHHHGFGGGMVNAAAAVAMAQDWINLPAPDSQQITITPNAPIPDRGELERIFDFSSGDLLRVETVEITVDIPHTFRGDLEIDLISPSGTVSRLAAATLADDGYNITTHSTGLGYEPWTFTSVRHWGESSGGIWKLVVRDRFNGDTGMFKSATVRLHGVVETAPVLTSHTDGLMVAEGADAVLSATATGERYAFEWRRNGVAVGGTLEDDFILPGIKLAQSGFYRVAAMTSVGENVSPDIPVTVVRVSTAAVSVKEGKTLTLTATASGPLPLTYQWRRDGEPLVEDEDGTGTQSKTLVIKNAGLAQEGDYDCLVFDGVRELSAGLRPVTILLKPVMTPQVLAGTIVSGQPFITFAALNAPARFVARGVPPGMKFNGKTGELSGRPNRPGTYTIRVQAANAAGSSAFEEYTLVIEDLPDGTVGTFRGLVDADPALNDGLGGAVQIKITTTGAFSGFIQLAGRKLACKGRLDAQPGGVEPTGAVTIRRRGGLPDLEAAFTVDLVSGSLAGTATDGIPPVDWTAQPDHWHAKKQPALSRAGYHTASLIDGDAQPAGPGFLAITVAKSGGIRVTGRVGDTSALTWAGVLSRDGLAPLMALIDKKRGSVRGWLNVEEGAAPDFLDGTVDGTLAWAWSATLPPGRFYTNGFLRDLTVDGAKYSRPQPGQTLLGLPDSATLPDGLNAEVTFAGGGVEDAALAAGLADLAFSLTNRHKAVFAPAKSAGNPASVKLTLNAAKGLLSGSFLLVDPNPYGGKDIQRKVAFYGRIGDSTATGCFLLPQLPDPLAMPPQKMTETPQRSGSFVVGEP